MVTEVMQFGRVIFPIIVGKKVRGEAEATSFSGTAPGETESERGIICGF